MSDDREKRLLAALESIAASLAKIAVSVAGGTVAGKAGDEDLRSDIRAHLIAMIDNFAASPHFLTDKAIVENAVRSAANHIIARLPAAPSAEDKA